MLKILPFIRQNAIALLALFVAIGGSSYAAVTINGSQIRNRTINAVKLNPKSISASISAWAIVFGDTSGAAPGPSSSPIRVQTLSTGEVVSWPHRRFAAHCVPSVTPFSTAPTGGFSVVTAGFVPSAGKLTLDGFGPNYAPGPQAAYVMIVCP